MEDAEAVFVGDTHRKEGSKGQEYTTSKVLFCEFQALDHGPHGSIDDHDALLEDSAQLCVQLFE